VDAFRQRQRPHAAAPIALPDWTKTCAGFTLVAVILTKLFLLKVLLGFGFGMIILALL
jgi:hypothetical protein